MNTVLHSYANHIEIIELEMALAEALPNFKYRKAVPVHDSHEIRYLESGFCKVLIHSRPTLCWPLEIDVKGDISNTVYAGFTHLQFGEWLVNKLGGEFVVDCGGIINPVLSDYMVRITKNKWETVMIPDEGHAVDEDCTKEIQREV